MATYHVLAASLLFLSLMGPGATVEVNPVSKVLDLLGSLEAKITAEGEAEAKAYKEFAEWCDDSKMEAGFAIKTATKEIAEENAAIAKATSDGSAADEEIESLVGSIATGESELKDATTVRDKEHADFVAAEAELVDTVDTLDRAVVIISREMAKNPALLQKKVDSSNMQSVLQTLSILIDAASLTGADGKKLIALVQNKQGDEDSDEDMGAPAAAVYKSHSSSIVDVLEDLKDKAEEQLADVRKAESNSAHNFSMLKQSLEDQVAYDNKELGDAKSGKAAAAEARAAAEGDLAVSTKELANAESAQATLNGDCQTAAADHEESMKNRAGELKALAEAKGIISSKTGGAEAYQYSLLQTSSQLRTRTDLVNMEVVTLVKKLAREQHSSALAQLASRIAVVMRYGTAGGDDVFGKVKSLITELIDRLEKEAGSEATQKAYCDEQMAKTAEKKAELDSDIAKLTTKIDIAVARSAQLKEEVATLQSELAALAKSQAEMDSTRIDEHAAFVQAKADLEEGISGIQGALSVLRDYYASSGSSSLLQDPLELAPAPELAPMHTKAEGAGSSIVGILEVVESDFSKSLATETVAEEEAQTTYEKVMQENKITKAMKDQDVKYKSQEATSLDKEIAENSSDKDVLLTELSAVLEYGEKLNSMCVAKPETYEDRSKRRQAEIAGLKDALNILNGEAFLQRRITHHRFLQ